MNFLANPIPYEIVKSCQKKTRKEGQQGGEGKGKVVIFMLSSITEKGVPGQRRLGNTSQGDSPGKSVPGREQWVQRPWGRSGPGRLRGQPTAAVGVQCEQRSQVEVRSERLRRGLAPGEGCDFLSARPPGNDMDVM